MVVAMGEASIQCFVLEGQGWWSRVLKVGAMNANSRCPNTEVR